MLQETDITRNPYRKKRGEYFPGKLTQTGIIPYNKHDTYTTCIIEFHAPVTCIRIA